MAVAAMILSTGCGLSAKGNDEGAKLAGETPGPGECATGQVMEASPAGLQQTGLCIKSGGKVHNFTVELALTGRQQAQGLMFRTELGPDAGMIFPFSQPKFASFWMKNTVISLDIIFIRADGRIENIAENTIPYSTDPVLSTSEVASVLELAAGRSAELGLKPGDEVLWKLPPVGG